MKVNFDKNSYILTGSVGPINRAVLKTKATDLYNEMLKNEASMEIYNIDGDEWYFDYGSKCTIYFIAKVNLTNNIKVVAIRIQFEDDEPNSDDIVEYRFLYYRDNALLPSENTIFKDELSPETIEKQLEDMVTEDISFGNGKVVKNHN